jgi:hypothetical protein
MRIPITAIVISAAVILAGSLLAPGQGGQSQQGDGVLSVLHKDQPVGIKEVAGRYEINVIPGGPPMLSHKVVEAGQDFLVLEDIVRFTELRIPIYSIKAVTVLHLPATH